MKRISLSILLLAVLIGCARSELEEAFAPSAPTLYAEIADEADSRTYLEEAKYMRWHAEDEISSFLGNTLNQRYGFDGKTGANSGTFSQVSYQLGTGNPISYIQAVYPYASTTTIDDRTGAIGYIFPKVQQHGEGDTYGPGANPMVATTSGTSDVFLYFRNVGGYLKLLLYGEDVTVTGISVKGNRQEKLSGEALITATYNADPQVQMTDAATEGVVLDCGEGVQLSNDPQNPTLFWIVMPPTTFEGGFTITIRGDNGKGCIKSTGKKQVITRNNYVAMSAFSVVCDQEIDESDFKEDAQVEQAINIPNNQIWYSTKNCMAYDFTSGGTIDQKEAFGAKMLSNIYYPEGYGVLNFAGDVTKLSGIFKGNTMLTEIKLPGSILSIDDDAFRNCTSLESVTLSKGITSIGMYAFRDCSSLANITLPEGLVSIGNYAFASCDALTSITLPEGVSSIGNFAFSSCDALASITLPESLTSIGNYAFSNCTSLASITLPEGVSSIGGYAFSDCSSLASITLPESLTSIGNHAFGNCTSLASITIPSSITLESSWFSASYSLKEIYGQYASEDHRCWVIDGELVLFAPAGITSYDVPAGVTSIGDSVFRHYTSLESITLPEGVVSIGEDAFYGCTSLKSITLPEGVSSIGYRTFYYCPSLKNITLPEGLTSIGDLAFDGCKSLASITLPEGVSSIGNSAFRDCTSLASITLPNSISTMGSDLFNGCSSLKEIHGQYASEDYRCWIVNGALIAFAPAGITSYEVPAGVTSIGDSAFTRCTSLASITLPEGLISIGNSAFHSCTSLESITLPEGVSSIGNTAFHSCKSLKSITLPEGASSIGNYAFYYCTSLASITLPEGVTSIGYKAFNHCKSLESITLPEGVTSIGMGTFTSCTSLASITLPKGLTTIDVEAFLACTSLESITLPEGLISLGRGAFRSCTSLVSIVIPNRITTLQSDTFSGCSSLTTVTLPESITELQAAFPYCSSLSALYCKATMPPKLSSATFNLQELAANFKIYVPASDDDSIINAYRTAQYWSDFSDRIEEEIPSGGGEDTGDGEESDW